MRMIWSLSHLYPLHHSYTFYCSLQMLIRHKDIRFQKDSHVSALLPIANWMPDRWRSHQSVYSAVLTYRPPSSAWQAEWESEDKELKEGKKFVFCNRYQSANIYETFILTIQKSFNKIFKWTLKTYFHDELIRKLLVIVLPVWFDENNLWHEALKIVFWSF